VAPLGALSAVLLMLQMPFDTWLRLSIWLVIGISIYLSYGVRQSHLQKASIAPQDHPHRRRS
jgi:APA family basic amino acid/polyamine antiporter